MQLKENFNREGLGQAINSDNIQREEAEEIIRKYAASDELEDLSFSSELQYDERKEIAIVAKKYGLVCRRANHQASGRKQTFLIISKKVGPEFIIEQLEREGSWGKYELVRPSGSRPGDTGHYLQFQHLRRTQGFPQELGELAQVAGERSFKKSERGGMRTNDFQSRPGNSQESQAGPSRQSSSGPPSLMGMDLGRPMGMEDNSSRQGLYYGKNIRIKIFLLN